LWKMNLGAGSGYVGAYTYNVRLRQCHRLHQRPKDMLARAPAGDSSRAVIREVAQRSEKEQRKNRRQGRRDGMKRIAPVMPTLHEFNTQSGHGQSNIVNEANRRASVRSPASRYARGGGPGPLAFANARLTDRLRHVRRSVVCRRSASSVTPITQRSQCPGGYTFCASRAPRPCAT